MGVKNGILSLKLRKYAKNKKKNKKNGKSSHPVFRTIILFAVISINMYHEGLINFSSYFLPKRSPVRPKKINIYDGKSLNPVWSTSLIIVKYFFHYFFWTTFI